MCRDETSLSLSLSQVHVCATSEYVGAKSQSKKIQVSGVSPQSERAYVRRVVGCEMKTLPQFKKLLLLAAGVGTTKGKREKNAEDDVGLGLEFAKTLTKNSSLCLSFSHNKKQHY